MALATEAATVKVPLEATTYDAGEKKVQRLTLSPAESKTTPESPPDQPILRADLRLYATVATVS